MRNARLSSYNFYYRTNGLRHLRDPRVFFMSVCHLKDGLRLTIRRRRDRMNVNSSTSRLQTCHLLHMLTLRMDNFLPTTHVR